jgi:hypothetical protein
MRELFNKPIALAVLGFMVLFIGLLALYLANAIAMDKGAGYGDIYAGSSIFLFLLPGSLGSLLWIRAGALKTALLGVFMIPTSVLLSLMATAVVFVNVIPLCG